MIVSIEGNIGSGKTTLLNDLKNIYSDITDEHAQLGYFTLCGDRSFSAPPPMRFIEEKLHPNLKEFYAGNVPLDQFEIEVAKLKVGQFIEATPTNEEEIVFLDSSPLSSLVFLETILGGNSTSTAVDGAIDETVSTNLYKLREILITLFAQGMEPDTAVWIPTETVLCSKRIQLRARPGETAVTSHGLKALAAQYNDCLLTRRSVPKIFYNGNAQQLLRSLILMKTAGVVKNRWEERQLKNIDYSLLN